MTPLKRSETLREDVIRLFSTSSFTSLFLENSEMTYLPKVLYLRGMMVKFGVYKRQERLIGEGVRSVLTLLQSVIH